MRTNDAFHHHAVGFFALGILIWLMTVIACTPITRLTVSPTTEAKTTPTLEQKTLTPEPSPTLIDTPEKSIFTDQPCAPPCWYGIIAGETRREDLLRRLKENPFIIPTTIKEYYAYEYPMPEDTRVIAWNYLNKVNRGGSTFLKDGTVEVIRVDVESQISLGDLIKHFGEPNQLQLVKVLYQDTQTQNSSLIIERFGFKTRAYYSKLGLVFDFSTNPYQGQGKASIGAGLAIDAIFIFPRSSVTDFISIAKLFKGPTSLGSVDI